MESLSVFLLACKGSKVPSFRSLSIFPVPIISRITSLPSLMTALRSARRSLMSQGLISMPFVLIKNSTTAMLQRYMALLSAVSPFESLLLSPKNAPIRRPAVSRGSCRLWTCRLVKNWSDARGLPRLLPSFCGLGLSDSSTLFLLVSAASKASK